MDHLNGKSSRGVLRALASLAAAGGLAITLVAAVPQAAAAKKLRYPPAPA